MNTQTLKIEAAVNENRNASAYMAEVLAHVQIEGVKADGKVTHKLSESRYNVISWVISQTQAGQSLDELEKAGTMVQGKFGLELHLPTLAARYAQESGYSVASADRLVRLARDVLRQTHSGDYFWLPQVHNRRHG